VSTVEYSYLGFNTWPWQF